MIGSDPAAVEGVKLSRTVLAAGVALRRRRTARAIVGFLAVIVASALLSLAPAAALPADHRRGHPRRRPRPAQPARRRSIVARPRSATRCSRWSSATCRRASARASSTTCGCRCSTTSSGMPMSFFTRAQTGALTSRMNNDVLGAQRARHRHARLGRVERRHPRRQRRRHRLPRLALRRDRPACCSRCSSSRPSGSAAACRTSPASRWTSTRP